MCKRWGRIDLDVQDGAKLGQRLQTSRSSGFVAIGWLLIVVVFLCVVFVCFCRVSLLPVGIGCMMFVVYMLCLFVL